MRKNNLSIHSENILPIIKKWLYSSRDIFVRELISNSCDAMKKLRILCDCEQASLGTDPLEIHVRFDKDNKTITLSDNGIGMTEEEVEKYIAQIAFSSAEEFVSKYKDQSEKDPMIGHFGLGFYSSYMVAARVEIQTLSYLPDAKPVFWQCDGSSTYEIGAGTRTKRGTDVILHLDDAHLDLLDSSKLRKLLEQFCSFMPDPIFLEGQPIHNEAPLWIKPPAECTDQEYRLFFRKLYPTELEPPLFWIHLNVDYPFHLQGILYFPTTTSQHPSRKPNPIHLFCNRVFVSDDCREILPEYLTLLCGAIDSPDIPLNVSRSYLQVDQNVRQVGAHVSKKVADRLNALYKTDRATYISHWPEFEFLMKLGLLQDEKFYDRIKDSLIWKNSSGEWTTLQEYLDRAKEKKVYYCHESCSTTLQRVYLDKQLELLYTDHPINTPVLSKLERIHSIQFQRIDSEIDPKLLDETRAKTVLDADGKTLASRMAAFFQSHLNLTVEAKSLASDSIAGMILLDEQSRRMRDFFHFTQQYKVPPPTQTLIINTNNKLVQTAWSLSERKPELAQQLVQQIYDLSRASQKEIEPKELDGILARNQQLLEQLAAFV